MDKPKRMELVLGRAGSGKTEWVLQQIRQAVQTDPAGPPIWWVVPPHATYEAERRLLEVAGSVLRVEVMTLDRLALRLLPPVLPLRPLNQTGARLLLAEVLEQLEPRLEVLRRDQPAVPFLDALLEAMRELAQYGVDPDVLSAWLEQAATTTAHPLVRRRPRLLAKLRDIGLIYGAWRKALETYAFYDPQDLPALALSLSSQWPDIGEASLLVDGFNDLTLQQLELVRELACRTARTAVTLRLDPQLAADLDGCGWEPNRPLAELMESLGAPAKAVEPEVAALYVRLKRMAASAELAPVVVSLGGAPRFCHPDLAAVEACLADVEEAASAAQRVSAMPHVALMAAANPRSEAEGAVQTVLEWAIRDGLDWHDILVLVPDLEEYGPLLRSRFSEHGIPATLDEFPPLAMHPLGKYLLALLRCAEEGLRPENAIRVLKTEFCGLSRTDADWLEQYVAAYEVPEAAWLQDEPWSFAYDARDGWRSDAAFRAEDARADALRRQVVKRILPVMESLRAPLLRPSAVAETLWEALSAADSKRIVAQWIVNERAEWTPLEASQHEQAWDAVLALLDDLARYPGDEPLSRGFLFELVRRGLADQRLTTIPQQAGSLRVSDFQRANGLEAAAVVVLGAVDGALPRRFSASGILGDEERLVLAEELGCRVGYTAQERQSIAQGTAYLVLTRARERLVLARPVSGSDGKARRPALAVARLAGWFRPCIEERWWTGEMAEGGGIWTERRAVRWLIDRLRTAGRAALNESTTAGLVTWFAADAERWRRLVRALAGLEHRTRASNLAPDLARTLFGAPLDLSPYQVEAFAACPYRHFLAYGLRLEEPRPPEPDAARRGSLVHDALQAFVDLHRQIPEAWRGLSDEQAAQSMRVVLEEVLRRPVHAVWTRSATRRRALRSIERVLAVAAIALTRQVRHGQYVPTHLEAAFGSPGTVELPPLTWRVGDTEVRLRGRIDRIDVADAGERRAFRIVDYKSGRRRLKMTEVEHGLNLQLLLYWLAVEQAQSQLFEADAEFAGVMVMPVAIAMETAAGPEAPERALEQAVRRMASQPWLVEDRELVKWMDERLEAGGTELFPAVYRKDGSPRAGAPVFTREQWTAIRRRVRRHLREAAARILAGDIAISPYRLGAETACTHCPYAAVCQIDPRWDPNPIRTLADAKPEAWLDLWSSEPEGSEGDRR